jgi:hypothetical protein
LASVLAASTGPSAVPAAVEIEAALDPVLLLFPSGANPDFLEDSFDNLEIAVISEPDVDADVGRCIRGGDVVTPFCA